MSGTADEGVWAVKYDTPPDCTGRERLKVTCRPRQNSNLVKAKTLKSTPGDRVHLCLDGRECERLRFNARGKATKLWKKVGDGTHAVQAEWFCGHEESPSTDCS